MRDAFGGAFMIKLFLVFIIVYVGFTAVALNYAKAFKVKNEIIEYIETNEITNIGSMSSVSQTAMEKYFDNEILGKYNYRVDVENTKFCSGENVKYCENGIKISEAGKAINTKGVYYKVEVKVGWSVPFINAILAINGSESNANTNTGTWKISGETRLIVSE